MIERWLDEYENEWADRPNMTTPRLVTPARMKEIRERMHLPVRSLARWASVSETSLRQMEAGQRSIPAAFGEWLEALGRWQEKHPPPEKSR